ncbi:MAG: hypothetical protein QOD39_4446 [Mycobacterium sp.]|nr:hypothetical protein [Mycobacterium sp.]
MIFPHPYVVLAGQRRYRDCLNQRLPVSGAERLHLTGMKEWCSPGDGWVTPVMTDVLRNAILLSWI